MARDKVRLKMSREGSRTLVYVMESGAVKIADNLTADEVQHINPLLQQHLETQQAEMTRLRNIAIKNGLNQQAGVDDGA